MCMPVCVCVAILGMIYSLISLDHNVIMAIEIYFLSLLFVAISIVYLSFCYFIA